MLISPLRKVFKASIFDFYAAITFAIDTKLDIIYHTYSNNKELSQQYI